MINYKELESKVYNYPTKYPEGFTSDEMEKLLEDYPNVEMSKFNDAMMGNTCMMKCEDDGKMQIVNYHCDVLKALICGLENRQLRIEEWD